MGLVFVTMVLAFTGLSSALQPGLEYQYRYKGRVVSGFTDAPDDLAAAGFQTDVTVQVEDEHTVLVQMRQFKVGEFNGKLIFDFKTPVPLEYTALTEGVENLHKPFRINITRGQCVSLEVASKEIVWVTNIKKGLINILRAEPLKVNFGGQVGPGDLGSNVITSGGDGFAHKPTFGVREEGLDGTCLTWYSFIRLPDDIAARENLYQESIIEEDIQTESISSSSYTSKTSQKTVTKTEFSSKTSEGSDLGQGTKSHKTGAPSFSKTADKLTSKTSTKTTHTAGAYSSFSSISRTLWRMTRTVDYTSCEDLLTVQNMDDSHGCDQTGENNKMVNRALLGSYLVRGDHHGLRIEKAVVEGFTYVNLLAHPTERIKIITNQTLELFAVRRISQPLVLAFETRHIEHWHFETASFVPKPDVVRQTPLEEILTGLTPTVDHLQLYKSTIQKVVSEFAKGYAEDKNFRVQLNMATKLINTLTLAEIRFLYDTFKNNLLEKAVFMDMLLDAGSEQAIRCALQIIISENGEGNVHSSSNSFFMHLNINMKSPAIVPLVLAEVMKQKPDDHSANRAIALINFALLAKNMCLGAQRCHTLTASERDPNTCTRGSCNASQITEVFIPYIKKLLKDEAKKVTKTIWMELVYLETLINLGTPLAFDTLRGYALGNAEGYTSDGPQVDTRLRMEAIWGLQSYHLPETARSEAFSVLMSLFENIGDDVLVRQAAFGAMVSWRPDASWWQHVATSTRREPSRQLVSFIKSTMEAVAEIDDYYMKKTSKYAAAALLLAAPSFSTSVKYSQDLRWAKNIRARKISGWFNLSWLSNSRSLFPINIFSYLRTSFAGFAITSFTVGVETQGSEALLEVLREVLQPLSDTEELDNPHASVVHDIYHTIGEKLNYNVIKRNTKFELIFFAKLYESAGLLYSFILGKESLSEIGEALRSSTPRVNVSVSHLSYTSRQVSSSLYTSLGLPLIIQMSYPTDMYLDGFLTSVPSNSFKKMQLTTDTKLLIGDTTQSTVRILLPWTRTSVGCGVQTNVFINVPLKTTLAFDLKHTQVKVIAETNTLTPTGVFLADNLPFTIRQPMVPTTSVFKEVTYKLVRTVANPFTREHSVMPSTTGLSIKSSWQADLPFPDLLQKAYLLVSSPLELIPSSTTKYYRYAITFDPKLSTTKSVTTTLVYVTTEKTDESHLDNLEQFGQESQSADYYSQISQSASSSFAQFEDIVESDLLQEQQSTVDHISVVQQEYKYMPFGHLQSLSAALEFNGAPTQRYEVVLTWAFNSTNTRTTSKYQLTFLPTQVDKTVCVNLQVNRPRFLPLVSFEDVINTDLKVTIKSEVFMGAKCQSTSPVVKLEGSVDVSPKNTELITAKLRQGVAYDVSYPVMDIITSSMYEKVQLTTTWKEICSSVLLNLTYQLDDFIRASLYPKISFNYCNLNNPAKQMTINAVKNSETQEWQIWTRKPTEESVINNLKAPDWLQFLGSPANLLLDFDYHFLQGGVPNTCSLGHSKLRTMDGLEYPLQLSNCWSIMSMDCSDAKDGMLQVRKTLQGLEARLIWNQKGLLIQVSAVEGVTVNGEPVAPDNDAKSHPQQHRGGRKAPSRPPFQVIQVRGGYQVTLNDAMLILKVTATNIDLQIPANPNVHLCGLCGNNDGEKTSELVGPKGCIYTSPEVFALAWTPPGDDCSSFAFLGKRQAVNKFQTNCPKKVQRATGFSHPNASPKCTDFKYSNQTMPSGQVCKSAQPVPVCRQGCQPASSTIKPMLHVCESASRINNAMCSPSLKVTTLSVAYPEYCIRS